MLQKIYNITSNISRLFKKAYKIIRYDTEIFFHVREIDADKMRTILYCKRAKSFFKVSLESAISDPAIIKKIHPVQTCWIGYYYGKALREGKLKSKSLNTNILLNSPGKRYMITGLEQGGLAMTYRDHETHTEYTKSVADLAQNNKLLEAFGPGPACYIGIWAGKAVAKHGTEILIIKPAVTRPSLRVIK